MWSFHTQTFVHVQIDNMFIQSACAHTQRHDTDGAHSDVKDSFGLLRVKEKVEFVSIH